MDNRAIENQLVRKGNDLITSKYKATLLEQQVMAIALPRIQETGDPKDPLQAKLYPGELKQLVSDPAHIYRDLKLLSKRIHGHSIILEDGRGNFVSFAMIPNAKYEDGVFTISFNKELEPNLKNLEDNYTTMALSVLTSFKSSASFRIYEILRKEKYKINGGNYTVVDYNLSEFKFMIGLANPESEVVKEAIYSGGIIDWDEVYSKLDERDKKYERFSSFKTRVLDPAQKELEETSDIKFEYEAVRSDKSVKRIVFYIYNNTPKNTKELNERAEYLEKASRKDRQQEMPFDQYPDLYNKYVGHNNLAMEDITVLLKESGWNPDKIEKAIELADRQPYISNYMGWIISAMKNGYEEIPVLEGSHEQAVIVNDIKQSYEENKDVVADKIWNKAKSNRDFVDFLLEDDMTPAFLERTYDINECIDFYLKWKVKK